MSHSRTSIAFLSKSIGLAVSACLVAAIAFSSMSLNSVKIGGPLYTRIVQGKDLIADVLPPPAYVIEAFLTATTAVANPERHKAIAETFARLHKDYNDRIAFWESEALPPELKTTFLSTSKEPAEKFWALAEEELFPALAVNDIARAQAAFKDLTGHYEQHRAAIDRVVALATVMNKQTEKDAHDQEAAILATVTVVAAAMLLIVIASSVAVEFGIVRPIGSLNAAMETLASGNYAITIPFADRKDEIGVMARTLAVFRKEGEDRLRLIEEVEMRRRESEARKQELEGLAETFLHSADHLKAVLEREAHIVRACAKGLDTSSSHVEAQTRDGLAASSDAAANVKTVAEAANELSASTQRIAAQAATAHNISSVATEKAAHAKEDMAALSRVTGQIVNILDSIGTIASQTNLLSLNATIEAARAGEAGKGFAVVAGEVKNLAAQTAKATEEVSRLVTEINNSTCTAMASITAIAEQITNVTSLSGEISEAVARQEMATGEIAESVTRAARSTDGALTTSEQISAGIRATKGEVVSVSDAANSLFNALREFTEGIDVFLGGISPDFKDRRRQIRHEIDHAVSIIIRGQAKPARAVNISLEGAAFSGALAVKEGERVTIDFGGEQHEGTVRWIADGRFSVQFIQRLTEFPISLAQRKHAA